MERWYLMIIMKIVVINVVSRYSAKGPIDNHRSERRNRAELQMKQKGSCSHAVVCTRYKFCC
jgi:hypothetical protein